MLIWLDFFLYDTRKSDNVSQLKASMKPFSIHIFILLERNYGTLKKKKHNKKKRKRAKEGRWRLKKIENFDKNIKLKILWMHLRKRKTICTVSCCNSAWLHPYSVHSSEIFWLLIEGWLSFSRSCSLYSFFFFNRLNDTKTQRARYMKIIMFKTNESSRYPAKLMK